MAEIRSEGEGMSREIFINKGYTKAKRALNKLNESRELDYTQELVEITKNLSLEINCIRSDAGEIGLPLEFEIYALKSGETVDCCTVHEESQADSDIMYLLNCYV